LAALLLPWLTCTVDRKCGYVLEIPAPTRYNE
jgi:hypothetical protein